MLIYGINPVLEAIRAGRVRELRVVDRSGGRVADVVAAAQRAGVAVRRVQAPDIDRAARGGVHQGVIADVEESRDYSIDDLVKGASGVPLLVVLDGIEDPHNVGAILRTVDAAGADGVVRQSRHAAPLGGAAAKAAAGAVSHVRIAEVVNIARAVEELKESGIWTVGLAGDSPKRYDQIDLTVPTAIVLGAEGTGLRRLVRERCDWLVSIPMQGHVQSLNVSVAAGIALFEAVRQRKPGVG
ncbi:MAG TPA: 23S rRNA (guanosine(2251)-2'-O)-methyltransferase RlmB [Vicinamibacterales bacterium]|nr:23S rRNA (guanosine(2251)-2'-O)-methyltransferase RlmB [Vicinamibacterales bacterium]